MSGIPQNSSLNSLGESSRIRLIQGGANDAPQYQASVSHALVSEAPYPVGSLPRHQGNAGHTDGSTLTSVRRWVQPADTLLTAPSPSRHNAPPLQQQGIDGQQPLKLMAEASCAVEETGSLLLPYATGRAKQEMRKLVQSSAATESAINDWLALLCQRLTGKDAPELVACKKFVLIAGMNLLLAYSPEGTDIANLLSATPSVQHLLDRLPAACTTLKMTLGETEWAAVNKNSNGYNGLALIVLQDELNRYDAPALVQCAKKTATCQELVALTSPQYGTQQFNPKGCIKMAANAGGWKNLEAATVYVAGLLAQHMALAQGYRQVQTDGLLAPITFGWEELVSMLSHDDGWKNLAAATAYVTGLQAQRAALMSPRQSLKQIDELLAPITFTREELVSMLSSHGGWRNLEVANVYVTELLRLRTTLILQRYSSEQIAERLAPIAFAREELVSMLSHDDGWKNLEAANAYVAGLLAQRLALAQQGYLSAQIDQRLAPVTLTRTELVYIVSQPGGYKRLEEQVRELSMLSSVMSI